MGRTSGNTPPDAENDMTEGETEKGLVSSTGLGVELVLLLALLLSSSIVKLVLGDGERRLGEREGERIATNPLLPGELDDDAGEDTVE